MTGFVGSQREENPGGYEDSCTVLLHYETMAAEVKAAVVSPEERQLRFWVRGVQGSYKKVGDSFWLGGGNGNGVDLLLTVGAAVVPSRCPRGAA